MPLLSTQRKDTDMYFPDAVYNVVMARIDIYTGRNSEAGQVLDQVC